MAAIASGKSAYIFHRVTKKKKSTKASKDLSCQLRAFRRPCQHHAALKRGQGQSIARESVNNCRDVTLAASQRHNRNASPE